MDHAALGCGNFVQRAGPRELALAQGTQARLGQHLLLKWSVGDAVSDGVDSDVAGGSADADGGPGATANEIDPYCDHEDDD